MFLKSFEDMQKTSTFFMLKPANAVYGFIVTITFSIILILCWACFFPIDEVVKAQVLLRSYSPVSSVKCVKSGQIAKKTFENDDLITEGELLFELDSSAYKSQLEAFKKELERNETDIYGNKIYMETINTQKLPKIPLESDAYIKCSNYLNEYTKYENIIQIIKSKLEREKNKPEALKIHQTIVDLETELNQNFLNFDNWKNTQKLQTLEDEKYLQSQKNTIESRILELERAIKDTTIKAPIAGKISEITKLNVGDYLLAGEEVLRIIPQNDEKLKADIYVNPSYIAKVKTGNPVRIKFPGLPPSRYGMIETAVKIVPPDVTYTNNSSVFIVEAEINHPYLSDKNGLTAKLLPGIQAEARIVTDRSTFMQMVLTKLDFIK